MWCGGVAGRQMTKRKADDDDSANGSDDGKGRKSGECDCGVAPHLG